MDQQAFNRVVRIARKLLPKFLDAEVVSIDILLETWQNQITEPSFRFIHQRCLDAIRNHQREVRLVERSTFSADKPPDADKDSNDKAQVDGLMKLLSPFERKVIWYRFYRGDSLQDISKALRVDVNKIRETIVVALFKMRQEISDV